MMLQLTKLLINLARINIRAKLFEHIPTKSNWSHIPHLYYRVNIKNNFYIHEAKINQAIISGRESADFNNKV